MTQGLVPGDRGARRGRRSRALLDIGIGIAAILMPFIARDFVLFQISEVIVVGIAILGLSILVDLNGQVSLGHGAFFAIGAYAAAIAATQLQVPYFLAIPMGALLSFACGLLLGFPALRLEGVHLAIATFAFAASMPAILKLSIFEGWTGGVQGTFLDKPDVPFGLPLTADQWNYILILAVAAMLYVASLNMAHARSGRALRAVRDNPIAAAALGIDVRHYKIVAFGISAAFAGLAGAMHAYLIQFVAPEGFTIQLSISFVVGLVIGSLSGLRGAFLGAAVVIALPNYTEQISKGLSAVVFGVLIIVLTCAMPRLKNWLPRW